MLLRAVRACGSLLATLVALIAWTLGLVFLICFGVGGLLNFPDMSGLPAMVMKSVASWLFAYVAMAGILTGIWPAIRVGRWVWCRTGAWSAPFRRP